MLVASIFEDRHGRLEERGICIHVLSKFTACVAQKKLSVLLVSEAVGGDVIGFEGNGFLQCEFPLLDGLPRQSEHKIDIDVRESGCSEKME